MKLIALSLLAMPVLLLAQNKYCKGEYDSTKPGTCDALHFENVVPDQQLCGTDKKPQKVEGGIQQTNCTTFYDISSLPSQEIDPHTVLMAQLITNVFENGNTQMGYAAANDIKDCRGYTCGYIGFTTGTNDAYAVIQHYSKRKEENPFSKYMEALEQLTTYEFNDPRRADTQDLVGFAKVWNETACRDPVFVQTQLDVGHSMYLKPALKYAASVNVTSNLGKAIFYDTIVQHGWQYVEPLINLPRILALTGPRGADTEQVYLNRFLTTRRKFACCYPGKVWNDSSSRMSDLQRLVAAWGRNKDLTRSVHLQAFGVTVHGDESITFDKAGCKSAKPFKRLPSPDDIPIPQCSSNQD